MLLLRRALAACCGRVLPGACCSVYEPNCCRKMVASASQRRLSGVLSSLSPTATAAPAAATSAAPAEYDC
eukprot:COSAG06_NODE_36383_length_447_cov_6.727011_1_plen_69_part_10